MSCIYDFGLIGEPDFELAVALHTAAATQDWVAQVFLGSLAIDYRTAGAITSIETAAVAARPHRPCGVPAARRFFLKEPRARASHAK